jgi:hypothetical protein
LAPSASCTGGRAQIESLWDIDGQGELAIHCSDGCRYPFENSLINRLIMVHHNRKLPPNNRSSARRITIDSAAAAARAMPRCGQG